MLARAPVSVSPSLVALPGEKFKEKEKAGAFRIGTRRPGVLDSLPGARCLERELAEVGVVLIAARPGGLQRGVLVLIEDAVADLALLESDERLVPDLVFLDAAELSGLLLYLNGSDARGGHREEVRRLVEDDLRRLLL